MNTSFISATKSITNLKFKDVIIIFTTIASLSVMELASLGLIGVYISFLLDQSAVMEFLKINVTFFYNLLIPLSSNDQFFYIGLLLAFVFLAKFFLNLGASYIIFKFGIDQQIRIQNNLIETFLNQKYEDFISQNSSTSIVAVSTFARRYKDILQALFKIVSDLVIVLSAVMLLIFVDLEMFLSLLILFSVFSISFYMIFIKKVRAYGERFNKSNTEMVQSLSEISSGYKEIKVYGKESFFKEIFINSVERMGDAEIKQNLISISPKGMLEFLLIAFIVFFVSIAIGSSKGVNEIIISLGIFAATAVRIMPMINQIYASVNTINFGKDALMQLVSIINKMSPDKLENAKNEIDSKDSFRDLEFENIQFSYSHATDKKRKVFSNANLIIKKGDYVGIIGPSGSGKTTLIDLILCLLVPQDGMIKVNKKDLQKSISWWRKKIAYIPQEIFIIDASLKDNILLGDQFREDSHSRLINALKDAHLEDLVESLPDGIDSMLGERGVNLSGGQRQRIAIARALYHDREVLILDESTSSLDSETEEKISTVITDMLPNKTVIAIAHRHSTLKSCNKIIKIVNGEILEGSLEVELQKEN
jgi:ATP-binding cassette, subfamily B, bacterial PglK